MLRFRTVLLLAAMSISPAVLGQSLSSSEILHELRKLNTVGSVLYVAAHPDDENTALLAYLAQEERLETVYLSLTRGGGGQNLIGSELKERLGLIRANELLQARRIDGARQRFTRARDFGYSKNPEDTLENWDENESLGDVVYAIRSFQPDVIITRFNPQAGPTHGHHTVSAQLALKAFEDAADPNRFPEQLDTVGTHQAKRIFWNGYGRRGRDDASSETREIVELEVGKYNPYLGSSYTEIAARSRSMHKSQGFGRAGQRGPLEEKLVLLAGPAANGDFMDGVDTSWERYPGGQSIGKALAEAIDSFDVSAPWKSAPYLLEAIDALESVPTDSMVGAKRAAARRLLVGSLGLHIQAVAEESHAMPGDTIATRLEAVNRSPLAPLLSGLSIRLFDSSTWPRYREIESIGMERRPLAEGMVERIEVPIAIPEDAPFTQPFWLESEPTSGRYAFANERLLDLERVPAALQAVVTVELSGRLIEVIAPVERVISDPVKGEVRESVVLSPRLSVEPSVSIALFESGEPKRFEVTVSTAAGKASGRLEAEVPNGWEARIPQPEFALDEQAPSQSIEVVVAPPGGASQEALSFYAIDDAGRRFDATAEWIEYEHIGRHGILSKAETKAVRLNLARAGMRIACIEGVGDTVPEALRRIGYEIDVIEIDEIAPGRFEGYDTVILGPRAFDASEGLDRRFAALLEYVENGGTLVSQYNTTSFRAKSRFQSPYPLSLSRERVSEEKAAMRILRPEHPVFAFPNEIDNADFEGWIQERGLYYASKWDSAYDALLSANDRNEPPRDGGLLVARYGEGWYVYTGLSFFRQLPEGHPGAIRLFVNLISLGHGNESR